MDSLFNKNVESLKAKNPKLASKLVAYVPTDIPLLMKENGFYNLLYKNIYLHNINNPLGEAKEIFSAAENTPVTIHFIYGIGLGYLFQVVSANSGGTVILYEPDLNIMKTTLSLVDFTSDIKKNNIFITDNKEEAEEYIYQKSNTKNIPLLLSTPAYRQLDEKNFNNLVDELQRTVGTFGMDRRFTEEKFYPLLKQTLSNIPYLIKEAPLSELKDLYKNKSAVVVSAGPTLDKNIETLKKYRDKFVLIVVGTAMKSVAANGIKPDFICIIESNDCSKQIEGIDLSDINFITEPFSHLNMRKLNFKKIYSHISDNMPMNQIWRKITNLNTEEYFSKGTVSYTAINSARILGCNKIILVGQDLAYVEGQCYSKDSAYKDLICVYNDENKKWEIAARDFESYTKSLSNNPDESIRKESALKRLRDLNNSLYYVKGINGDMIPTESVYAAFIKPLSEFTKQFPDCRYINTSLVGAQIDGYENLSLEEALQDSEAIEKTEPDIDFKYDTDSIKDNLYKQKEELLQSVMLLEEIQKSGNRLKNDIKKYQTVNAEILKSLKHLTTGYYYLSSEYTKRNIMFDFITTAERMEIEYLMKMSKNLSIDNITSLTDKILVYSENAIAKINEVADLINNVCGEF